MNIRSFKLNELNIMSKIILTKAEAIGLCKRSNWHVRRAFMKHLVEVLSAIEGIKPKPSFIDKLIQWKSK